MTPEQCKAARAFLDLKQSELADMCGLSKTAIADFESGAFKLKSNNLETVHKAFDELDIEFIGDIGIAKPPEQIKFLEGPETVLQLWIDIFETLAQEGGEILVTNADSTHSAPVGTESVIERLDKIPRIGLAERALLNSGQPIPQDLPWQYRWITRNTNDLDTTIYLYGRKIAIQLWNNRIIIIIRNTKLNRSEQKRFERIWKESDSKT